MNHDTAHHYLVKATAQIIHDTVECNLADRSLTDWLEAEKLVNEHLGWAKSSLVTGDPRCGFSIFSPPWFGQLREPSYDEFSEFFGELVWRNVQPLRRYLPRGPYGMVTFH